jgi:hypothetical protein
MGTARAQRVLLGLVLLLYRLLGVHLPVAGPKNGTVLVLVIISPVLVPSTNCQEGRGRPRRGLFSQVPHPYLGPIEIRIIGSDNIMLIFK